MNLYELTKLEVEMMESLEEKVDIYDEETGEIVEENFDIMKNTASKVEGYYKIIRNFQGDIRSIDVEIERLKEMKDSKKRKVKRLTDNIKNYMVLTEKKKIELTIGSFGIRKSSKVIVDMEKVPNEFVTSKVTYSVDKASVKKELKNGKVEGCYIEENFSVNLK